MRTPPDGIVPDGMPEELDRVYFALDAVAEDPPDALLQRILRSRQSGERALLPVDIAAGAPARWPNRIRRAVIATIAASVLLASWSIYSHRSGRKNQAINDFQFYAQRPGVGFMSIAEAQTAGSPQFAPMLLSPGRLHAARLHYVRRSFTNGKLDGTDTVGYVIEAVGSPVARWRILSESQMSDSRPVRQPLTVFVTDTLMLAPTTLAPITHSYWARYSDGGWGMERFDFSDSAVANHFELHTVQYRPIPTGKERTGSLSQIVQDTVSPIRTSRYPRYLAQGGNQIALLMAAQIEAGMRFSVARLGQSSAWVKSGWTDYPLNLIVEGTARIPSPSGAVDCWKLVASGDAKTSYWLRKSDGLLIRKVVEARMLEGDAQSELELIQEQ
jgi:hypothetical protein